MTEQSAENSQFSSSPQQFQKSFRSTRRSAQLNATTPIVLNTQRSLQDQFLKTAELDPNNPLHHPQDLALKGNDVSRNLNAATEQLLTQDDGTAESQGLRQLEQIYINELRKELELNRSQNYTYEQKQKIFEAAQKRFERLIVQNSQIAAMMTSDVPETLYKFQQRYGEKQEKFEGYYSQIIDKHAFLTKQMDEMLKKAYEITRNDEKQREEYIQSNFRKWTDQAIIAGEKVSLKYETVDKRIQFLETQMSNYVNERKMMTQNQIDETLAKKEVIEHEYQQALSDRQSLKEQLEQKVFQGRDEQFDQFVRQKQEENNKKIEIKNKCEEIKAFEINSKQFQYEQKLDKYNTQLTKIQEQKKNIKEKQAQLLRTRLERARLQLQQQEEQRDEIRKLRDLNEDKRLKQRQDDEKQVNKQKSLQSDINHYKDQVVTKARITGDFDIPEKLAQKTTPNSILTMQREKALRLIVDYEEQNRKQFLPENIQKTPKTSTPSMRAKVLTDGNLTPKLPEVRSTSRSKQVSSNSLKRINDAENIYSKQEKQQESSKSNETQLKREYNQKVVELVQCEREREDERNQLLIDENDDQKRQILEKVFQDERDQFEQKLKQMEEEYFQKV